MGPVVAAHGLCCSLACGIFPDPEIKLMSPAMAGEFLSTVPPGKSFTYILVYIYFIYFAGKVSFKFRNLYPSVNNNDDCFFLDDSLSSFILFIYQMLDLLNYSSNFLIFSFIFSISAHLCSDFLVSLFSPLLSCLLPLSPFKLALGLVYSFLLVP